MGNGAVRLVQRTVSRHRDFEPRLAEGSRNAWLLSQHLADADRRVWVLPERQGSATWVGFPVGAAINCSIGLCLPE